MDRFRRNNFPIFSGKKGKLQTQYCKSGKSMICLFDLILYVSVNNFSVMSGGVFLGWTSTKQGLMCLAQGYNAVPPVRLKPTMPRSRVKHNTTEPHSV